MLPGLRNHAAIRHLKPGLETALKKAAYDLPVLSLPATNDLDPKMVGVQLYQDARALAERFKVQSLWSISEARVDALSPGDLTVAYKHVLSYLHFFERWQSAMTEALKGERKKADAAYPLARGDLVEGIGQYCSYCELPAVANLAIEHVLPRSSFPALTASWDNFLLSCAACNSMKSGLPDYLAFQPRDLPFDAPGQDLATTGGQALMSVLTPLDVDPDFLSNFSYRLVQVGRAGTDRLFVREVDESFLYGDDATPPEMLPSAVGGVMARVYRRIRGKGLRGDSIAQVKGFVEAWSNPQPPPSEQAGDVPQALSYFWLKGGSFGTYEVRIEDRSDASVTFRIWHTAVYRFDLSKYLSDKKYRGAAEIQFPDGTVSRLENRSGFNLMTCLVAGVLPRESFKDLGYTYIPAITAARPENVSGAAAILRVEMTNMYVYRIDTGMDYVDMWAAEEMPVELHLVPNGRGAARTRLETTVTLLNLNDDRDDVGSRMVKRGADPNNLVNRRVYRRTRAWFVAMASLRNAAEAIKMAGQPQPDVSAEDMAKLMTAIGETMAATGCWTVWAYVISKCASGTLRDDLGALLTSLDRFPGTRLPPPGNPQ